MEKRSVGLLQANAAAMLLGGTALFAQLIELPALLIISIRGVLAAAVLLLLLLFMRQRLGFDRIKDYVAQIGLGMLMGIHWAAYYHSIQLSTVTTGIATISAYPIYTVFIEALLGHEPLRLKKILVTCIIVAGVVMLIPEWSLANKTTEAVLWGILSGVAYAFRNVLTKPYLRNNGALPIMMHQAIVAGIFCGLLSFIFLDTSQITIDAHMCLLLLICGTIFTAGPHTLQVCAFAHLSASTVSNIVISQVFYATVFSLLILTNNTLDFWTVLGAACIVAGSVIESSSRR